MSKKHFNRDNNQLAFGLASLILTNNYLPVNEAFYRKLTRRRYWKLEQIGK